MSLNAVHTMDIPEDLCNKLEGLHYEVYARKDLLATMVRQGLADSEAYVKYHKEYVKFYGEYEELKNQVTNEYVAPKYPNSTWNLDFKTHNLTITENGVDA